LPYHKGRCADRRRIIVPVLPSKLLCQSLDSQLLSALLSSRDRHIIWLKICTKFLT
jgi:hypothetical protein